MHAQIRAKSVHELGNGKHRQGYWVRTSVKVGLAKEEKCAINPTSGVASSPNELSNSKTDTKLS
jgi:hypothetical protein